MSIKKPSYSVFWEDKNFEIRVYKSYITAEAEVKGIDYEHRLSQLRAWLMNKGL